ncbi:MAG: UTP--glucose-1-phosphate uridylyltransferase [Candidatus Nitrohelix vancouverensis]|uniref:UTP--glucose-1-phosphate uridylyltransferase n=1 Tax=Candidatus Nitrohelix vancouverensis TaxID=2705534 RepID=A0A7T0G3T7_9BACT|nr:MAG: UTP--glucose-1-phosphate uridylyltransferase [Candidatus Nitrohelix vancouverensis]
MNKKSFPNSDTDLPLDDPEKTEFMRLFSRCFSQEAQRLDWHALESPSASEMIPYESLPDASSRDLSLLDRVAVCKLNGGLGTSMGCTQTKSTIQVAGKHSFLELILQQIRCLNEQAGSDIPLILMNSFYTDEETRQVIANGSSGVRVEMVLQNKFPRIHSETKQALDEGEFGKEAWYPPGHGDLFNCFYRQGMIDALLQEGRDILFVSNSDNLGAEMDPKILACMLREDIPFLMEMTPKTKADVKGGTLYVQDGRLKLLEIARVPSEHIEEFQGQSKFKVFNTNNIWINLRHLKSRMEEGSFDLEVVKNYKEVGGVAVIQLETALGSALDCFPNARGLVVSRERFLPVKTTSDLLLLHSDLFEFQRGAPRSANQDLPQIRLSESFTHLEDFHERFPEPVCMKELVSLEIVGDVRFEGRCTFKGNVRLESTNLPLVIQENAILENCSLIQ